MGEMDALLLWGLMNDQALSSLRTWKLDQHTCSLLVMSLLSPRKSCIIRHYKEGLPSDG